MCSVCAGDLDDIPITYHVYKREDIRAGRQDLGTHARHFDGLTERQYSLLVKLIGLDSGSNWQGHEHKTAAPLHTIWNRFTCVTSFVESQYLYVSGTQT